MCFMRHGEDKKKAGVNIEDLGLTRRGIRDVKKSCKYYLRYDIKSIYCSPAVRTVQTANILAKYLKVPVTVLDDLNERFRINHKPNTTEEKEWWADFLTYNNTQRKHETCKTFFDRYFKALDEIKACHDEADENVIIVGHSASLYAISAYFHGIPKDGKVVWMQCGTCSRINFETQRNMAHFPGMRV